MLDPTYDVESEEDEYIDREDIQKYKSTSGTTISYMFIFNKEEYRTNKGKEQKVNTNYRQYYIVQEIQSIIAREGQEEQKQYVQVYVQDGTDENIKTLYWKQVSEYDTIESQLEIIPNKELIVFHAGNILTISRHRYNDIEQYVGPYDTMQMILGQYNQMMPMKSTMVNVNILGNTNNNNNNTQIEIPVHRLRMKDNLSQRFQESDTVEQLGYPNEQQIIPSQFQLNVVYAGHESKQEVNDAMSLSAVYEQIRTYFSLTNFTLRQYNGIVLEDTQQTLSMYNITSENTQVVDIPLMENRKVKYLCENCGQYVSTTYFCVYVCCYIFIKAVVSGVQI